MMQSAVSDLFGLDGKHALVTGGGSGIGLGMAEGLLMAGAKVVLAGHSRKAVMQAARLREQGFAAYALQADLREGEEAANLLTEKAADLLDGNIDILINAAGCSGTAPAESFPEALYASILELNLHATFHMCRSVGAHMLRNGLHGKIINVASLMSFLGSGDSVAYAASKGAVAQLTKSLANAWMRKGICVNAVAPGYVDTDLTRPFMEDGTHRYDHLFERVPAGRWGHPEDFRGVAVFLSSAASDFMSGVILPVDGGYLSR